MRDLDGIRIGKNHRICFNCDKKHCDHEFDAKQCDLLENEVNLIKKRNNLNKWLK